MLHTHATGCSDWRPCPVRWVGLMPLERSHQPPTIRVRSNRGSKSRPPSRSPRARMRRAALAAPTRTAHVIGPVESSGAVYAALVGSVVGGCHRRPTRRQELRGAHQLREGAAGAPYGGCVCRSAASLSSCAAMSPRARIDHPRQNSARRSCAAASAPPRDTARRWCAALSVVDPCKNAARRGGSAGASGYLEGVGTARRRVSAASSRGDVFIAFSASTFANRRVCSPR